MKTEKRSALYWTNLIITIALAVISAVSLLFSVVDFGKDEQQEANATTKTLCAFSLKEGNHAAD